jgi:hypothetical protein
MDLNRVPKAAQVLSPALQAHHESAELRNSEG